MLSRFDSVGIEKTRKYCGLVIFAFWFVLDFVFYLKVDKFSFANNTGYLNILRPIKYSAILYCIVLQKYKWKELAIIIPVAGLLFISGRLSREYSLFYIWIIMVMLKEIPLRDITRLAVILLMLGTAAAIALFFFGVLDEVGGSHENIGIERHSLGFSHPNCLALSIISIIMGTEYMRNKKVGLFDYVLLISAVLLIWFVPNSRTSAMCALLFLIMLVLQKNYYKLNLKIKKTILLVLVIILLVGVLFSVFLSISYDPNIGWLHVLNNLFAGRISLGGKAFSEFGASILGRTVYLSKSERAFAGLTGEIILDNAYMQILVRNGIVPLIIVLIGMTVTLLRLRKEDNYLLFIIIFVIGIYMTMENLTRNIVFCFFLTAILNSGDKCRINKNTNIASEV